MAMQPSESDYRRCFEASRDGIVVIEETGAVLDANRSFCALLNVPHADVRGIKITQLGFPDTFLADQVKLQDVQGDENTNVQALILPSVNGQHLHVELTSSTYRNGGRQILRCSIRDISERVLKVEQVQLNEKRYHSQRDALIHLSGTQDSFQATLQTIVTTAAETIGVARAGLWTVDQEQQNIRCVCLYEKGNDGCKLTPGLEVPSVRIPKYLEALGHSEVIAAEDAWRDDRTSELATDYLIPLGITSLLDARIFQEGKLLGVLCHEHVGPPRAWSADEETFAAALATFVSLAFEREARRLANERVHTQVAVMEAMANSIVITDTEGNIQWTNPAFTASTGYTRDEVIGKNPRVVVRSGFNDELIYKRLWQTITAGMVWQGELTNRRKDGTVFTEMQTITPILDTSGSIAHFVSVKVDMTERLKLEQELFQAQKMESIGRLAGGVAHDFNNLLTVIGGYTEMVLNRTMEGKQHADLEQVLKASQRASVLTNQLLAFSRLQMLQVEQLDLNEILEDSIKILRPLIGEDVELVLTLGEGLWRVRGDRGQFDQVIMNLAVNARDAMPSGGKLTIETCNKEVDEHTNIFDGSPASGNYVFLSVTDTGNGMDDSTKARIFEPSFTTKELGKGTGLGLATVYGIVKGAGGAIAVSSAIGHGTTMLISLPAAQADAPEAPLSPIEREIQHGTETVLIVEDEGPLLLLTERILQQVGYSVLTANNGMEALSVVEQAKSPINLVITDIVMPGMGGRELATRLNVMQPDLKVLYISGYADKAAALQSLGNRQSPLLTKPFSAAQLTRKLREVLDDTLFLKTLLQSKECYGVAAYSAGVE